MSTNPCRRGVAIITTMVLIITLVAMSATLTKLTVSGMTQQEYRADTTTLLLSAESGVNLAIAHLQQNYTSLLAPGGDLDLDDPNKDMIVVPLADYADADLDPSAMINGHTLDVSIAYQQRNTEKDSVFLITSTASDGAADEPGHYRRTVVETTVAPIPQQVFDNAMLAIEGYAFTGNAGADSWDSASGDFDTAAPSGGFGDLASEGDITTGSSTTFDNVYDNREFPLPVFDYQTEKNSAGALTPIGGGDGVVDNAWVGGSHTLTSGAYSCTAIDLSGNNHLVIDGEVSIFVDEHVILNPNNNDRIIQYVHPLGSAPNQTDPPTDPPLAPSVLSIYQGDYTGTDSSFDNNGGFIGDVEKTGGSGQHFTASSFPANFRVLTEYSGLMTMNGNGHTSGIFFAPQATVKFNGTFNFYGSVVAQRFDTSLSGGTQSGKVNGTFDFHYDESLAELDLDTSVSILITGWRTYNLGAGAP